MRGSTASEKTRFSEVNPGSGFRERGDPGPKDLFSGFTGTDWPSEQPTVSSLRASALLWPPVAYRTFPAYLGRTPPTAKRNCCR